MTHCNDAVREPDNMSEWLPSNHEKAAIRQQLLRILSDPLFANSKRYPGILRFVVEESLCGRADQLKERTVGIEVFGRNADYDTNVDHIVRTAASEVRKRLAMYYRQEEHASEIRIELPSGAYAPVFRPAPVTAAFPDGKLTAPRPVETFRLSSKVYVIAAVSLCIGVAVGVAFSRISTKVQAATRPAHTTLVEALRPKPGQHVDVVVGDSNLTKLTSLDEYRSIRLIESETTRTGLSSNSPLSGLNGALEITNALAFPMVLQVLKSIPVDEVSLMHPAQVTDQSFRQDNLILIGSARVDPWVQLVESRLHYQIETLPNHHGIRNISPQDGEGAEYLCEHGHCYASVAYIPNASNTGKILLVAGITRADTAAAVNFATDTGSLHTLFKLLGIRDLGQLPSFELMLSVQEDGDTPLESHVVAWRKL